MFIWAIACFGSNNKEDSIVLHRIFTFKQNNAQDVKGTSMNVYTRHHVSTIKRNKLLITIPTMYRLARSENKEFVGESYSRITFRDIADYEEKRQVAVGTVPRHKRTLPTMLDMLTPDLYGVTIMENHILSPFHRKNKGIYRYGIIKMPNGYVHLVFVPRITSTQTIRGNALVNYETGNIEEVEFEGEYDMISFHLKAQMGRNPLHSLLPRVCDLDATFHMAGNRILASYHAEYDLPMTLPDSIVESHSRALMDSIRPCPLPPADIRLYQLADSIQAINDKLPKKIKKRNLFKYVFWDVIGDNLVNRIKGNFGPNNAGFYKIYPLIDPLSISYSKRKGFTYKVRFRGNYDFTQEQGLELYCRVGYSFKQKQLYYLVPVKYTFMSSRNGFVEVEVGNGNRIRYSNIKNSIDKDGVLDSIKNKVQDIDYFKDFYWSIRSNYDISKNWGVGLGFTYHRRTAVQKELFSSIGLPSRYYSFAPRVTTQIRPLGWNGPIFTINYEQGLKGVSQSQMSYGRFEADASWMKRSYMLRAFSMRAGFGMYLLKDKKAYFLDYENFRDENIPGGWNDDWTGEFQLLSSEQYNNSDYYIRTNLTYESPLMLLSRAPLIGKYIEIERIYGSTLIAKNIHPYTELGYGFTNRLFSFGLFVGTTNGKFQGFGCRIGLELFRNW